MIGPKDNAGKNVRTPTMNITPTSRIANRVSSVENVPLDGGVVFFVAMLPAIIMTGIITPNLPISIAKLRNRLKYNVLAFNPAKALPLFSDADVKAYNISLKPCGPLLDRLESA